MENNQTEYTEMELPMESVSQESEPVIRRDEMLTEEEQPELQEKPAKKGSDALGNTWSVLKMTGKWAYQLRSVLLAIPVAVAAVALALRNMAKLPAKVGIDLLASGEHAYIVSKAVAVWGPLAITAVCLLMVFLSRKVLYPWLISVLSLVLPLVLWFINVFPN